MRTLEQLGPETWAEFIASPKAVLVLSKKGCEACVSWAQELEEFLAKDEEAYRDFRIGKMSLSQRGLIDFKRANPWLAEVDVMPFNVLYIDGEVKKKYGGGGIDRLTNRMKRFLD